MGKIRKKAGGVSLKSYYHLVRHDGNQELFRTVEMSVIALASGYPFHIHAEGLRGTGKTTIMRAVKDILPPIVRIKNCIYNCHPAQPHCPEHRSLSPEQIAAIGTEVVPCPFLEISHSAKLGTVVGSIDLGKLTDKVQPIAALLPGTIPQAHRGIIFIDEINRLADTSPELADILLDVMGTKPGRIQVEETGLPTVELPVNVTIWAASNPDEEPGPLAQVRRQLSDRFDLSVSMGRPASYQDILSILEGRNKKITNYEIGKFNIPGNINLVEVDDQVKNIFAAIYVDFGIESLRAVEGMETAAGILALMSGRRNITVDDVIKVVPSVLGHRTDKTTITSILKYLENYNVKPLQHQCSLPAQRDIQQPATAEISEQVQYKNPAWKRVLSSIINKLTIKKQSDGVERRSQATASTTPAHSASRTDQLNSMSENNAGSGAAAAKVTDPSQSQITAPPANAIPLAKHSLDQFVSNEDNK